MPPKAKPPVEVDELKNAILRMMVREFDGRLLTWDVAPGSLLSRSDNRRFSTGRA